MTKHSSLSLSVMNYTELSFIRLGLKLDRILQRFLFLFILSLFSFIFLIFSSICQVFKKLLWNFLRSLNRRLPYRQSDYDIFKLTVWVKAPRSIYLLQVFRKMFCEYTPWITYFKIYFFRACTAKLFMSVINHVS